jgi:hypothetical protein
MELYTPKKLTLGALKPFVVFLLPQSLEMLGSDNFPALFLEPNFNLFQNVFSQKIRCRRQVRKAQWTQKMNQKFLWCGGGSGRLWVFIQFSTVVLGLLGRERITRGRPTG